MAVTRLDWDVFTYGTHPRLAPFPWITGRVRKGDAYTVLDELCRRFNNEVEKINPAHSWGWAYRPVRGATVVSEHAAGTAIDLNAPKHPLGRQGTFTRSQVNKINQILRDLDGAVRWGGNYAGRKDEMHFELQGGVKKLAAVAKKIKGSSTGTASTTNTATSKPVSKPATVKTGEWPTYPLLVDGKYQSLTKRGYQRLLAPKNVGNYQGRIDAVMGALTTRAEQTWLKRLGFYRGLIDGQRGPVTIKALQRFLRSKRFYSGLIDGKFQVLSIKGLQQYLNSQRKFYK